MKDTVLLDKICFGFNEVQKKDITGRSIWTNAFKEVLISIGKETKFKVCTTLRNKNDQRIDWGEWLFDLCWSKVENGIFKGLKLICECEWNMDNDDLLDDFYKLIVGKADIKLMIVQYNQPEQFKQIRKRFEETVDKSLYMDNSKYILIGSGNKNEKIDWIELWQ